MSDINESTIFGIFHRAALPEGATPVDDFELDKYLGVWYERARMNFYWENENLINTSAEYQLNDDGTVKVINRGYDTVKEKWQEFTGKAKFRGDNTMAALDVSFFGPSWAGYNVLSIDQNYNYALVAGRNTDYMWILSRTLDTIPADIKIKYQAMLLKLGYDLDAINWTEHKVVGPSKS